VEENFGINRSPSRTVMPGKEEEIEDILPNSFVINKEDVLDI